MIKTDGVHGAKPVERILQEAMTHLGQEPVKVLKHIAKNEPHRHDDGKKPGSNGCRACYAALTLKRVRHLA